MPLEELIDDQKDTVRANCVKVSHVSEQHDSEEAVRTL